MTKTAITHNAIIVITARKTTITTIIATIKQCLLPRFHVLFWLIHILVYFIYFTSVLASVPASTEV